MYNKELVLDILLQVLEATHKIEMRFATINKPEDFVNSQEGMEKLDAICMQLIAIGESFKKIDKITNKSFLQNYSNIDWKGVMGLRDIIAHHYFDIDAEEIFVVCKKYMPTLAETIQIIIKDLK